MPGAVDLASRALDLIDDLEAQLTVYHDDSEVSRLNATAHLGPVAVEPGLFGLLERAVELSRLTGGAYDVTSGALSRSLGLRPRAEAGSRRRRRSPTPGPGPAGITCGSIPRTVTVAFDRPGIRINLGSIGKGYAIDRAVDVIREPLVAHLGARAWRPVEPVRPRLAARPVRRPLGDRPAQPVSARDSAGRAPAAEPRAGDVGRGVPAVRRRRPGVRPHHRPQDRRARASGPASVTVLAPTAADADALSTAFYLLGPEAARDYVGGHPEVGVVIVEEGPADESPRVLTSASSREDFLIDRNAVNSMMYSVKNLRARVLAGARGCRAAWPASLGTSRTDHHALLRDPAGPPILTQLSRVPRRLFLVLLRIAIGWHFLTEGLEKVESTRYGKQPFSAEIYLRNATGRWPLISAACCPTPTAWPCSTRPAQGELERDRRADREPLQVHRRAEGQGQGAAGAERTPGPTSGSTTPTTARPARSTSTTWPGRADRAEPERHVVRARAGLGDAADPRGRPQEADRAAGREGPGTGRRGRRPGDARSSRPRPATYTAPLTFLDVANLLTMYGLCAIGVCLILGFLTPLAAVCAAAFLAMIYLSMPPWPGLPPNPKTEGHYWIVSKNLVELIACLLIAVTASGHWFGLDALFFGAPPPPPLGARHEQQAGGEVRHQRNRQARRSADHLKPTPHRDPILILTISIKERGMTNLTPEERDPGPRERRSGHRHDPARLADRGRRHAAPWPASTSATRRWGTSPRSRPRSSAPATKAARR